MRLSSRLFFLLAALLAVTVLARAEDGYRLWLRYDRIDDEALRASYAAALAEIAVAGDPERPAFFGRSPLAAARDELSTGLSGLLGTAVPVVPHATRDGAIVVGTARDPALFALVGERDLRAIGEQGYLVRRIAVAGGQHRLLVIGNREIGALYGAFALLRHLQTHQPIASLDLLSAPRIDRRILNHWDALNRHIERGYAGFSLWQWFYLPEYRDPRYRDYARACASIGINGAVLTGVNAESEIFQPEYLPKIAALAQEFRPYGVRVYLSVRWTAPRDLGGAKTADPLDPAVAAWWRAKAAEIYKQIPDFGGFLVKANSEGEPGPQDYGRNHADGANMLADAVAPYGGIVMWRAFVYAAENSTDRVKQAYHEFAPLDGKFRANVAVQIKNGPLDFMPREPFHPLFGGLAHTPVSLELQISQEYLGQATHLAYLAPMWKEVLDADTFAAGPGSTVARVVDGSVHGQRLTIIAGVANTGDDRDWTGHPLSQANWYAFGRLAWDHTLTSAAIADEWIRQTFGHDPRLVQPIAAMLLASREAVVDYSMPLGLAHLMATGHHYGPGPWVGNLPRADWNPTYYHRADAAGLGFDRTAAGSNAVEQYAPALARRWSDLATCPDEFLLWFHHVPWDYKMRSGATLWDELARHYQRGVDTVRGWQRTWAGLQPLLDAERYEHVRALLTRQEQDARDWRDASLLYFGQFSHRPLPAGVEPPAHPLQHYEAVTLENMPGYR